MGPLSVVIVACNEAARISKTLKSVDFADEKIVIDGGSSDETPEISRSLGATVILHPFEGFLTQQQFALTQARNLWVLSLDADECVSPELADSIQLAVKHEDSSIVGFRIGRLNHYLGRPVRRAGWYPDQKLRLVKRTRARWQGHDPHPYLWVDGPIGTLNGDLLHHSYGSLLEHARKVPRYAEMAARSLHARNVRPSVLSLIFRPSWYFFRRYILARGFLEGIPGLLVCVMGSYYVFLKYALLYQSLPHPDWSDYQQ